MFDLNYPIAELVPAAYNPRKITPEAISKLQDSIRLLGVCKPVIIRRPTIVAGHQRTKALTAMGETTVPAYLLSHGTTEVDEVRFNQLHNGTDLDMGDEECFVDLEQKPLKEGYQQVPPRFMTGNAYASAFAIRHEITRLVKRYGPWGSVVAVIETGEVIHAAQYALACMGLGKPVLIYGVHQDKEKTYREYLNADYGEFSYDHIKRVSYIQSLAQPMRGLGDAMEARPEDEKDAKVRAYSALYGNHIDPFLEKFPEARVLDFGSGAGEMAALKRKRGYRVTDFEPFRRVGKTFTIDVRAVKRLANKLAREVEENGLFDAVLCDSVMNSVESTVAQKAVLACLNAFCKVGGFICLSGRDRHRYDEVHNSSKPTTYRDSARHVEFMTDEGETAINRQGEWFFQRYHYAEQVEEMGRFIHLDPDTMLVDMAPPNARGWQLSGTKKKHFDWEELQPVLEFEFDLLVSDGIMLGYTDRMKEVLNNAHNNTRSGS